MEIIDNMIGDDLELRELVERATINAYVSQLIYNARTAARLTQQQLADMVGTRQSVIARLEDADYDGHSLTMLMRSANALNRELEVRLIPIKRRRPAA